MHVSHQSTRSIARRIVIAAVAAAALSTPVVVEMSAHAAPERGTHAVAMPDCINNWSPICDRWDVPGTRPAPRIWQQCRTARSACSTACTTGHRSAG